MCRDVQALVQKQEMQKALGVSSRKDTMNFNLLNYFVHIRKLSFFPCYTEAYAICSALSSSSRYVSH